MRIGEAIEQVDELLANTFSRDNKIKWLSTLDMRVKTKIVDTHEGSEQIDFNGYPEDIPDETVLLIPAPYDEMYLRWLEAQIHYYNHEEDRYNNAIEIFNVLWKEFRNYYNRVHLPKGQRFRF